MYSIDVYKSREDLANIETLSIKREWMDQTYEGHAYHCFPVSLENQLGWSISFPEDITFIWDGISDSSPDHVKILSGEKYAYSGRANGTISFNTGLMFNTKENITLLSMPVPNLFIDGATAFTTLVNTSFFSGELPCALMITKPNEIITIKAETPIIAIIPINLSLLQNSEINVKNYKNLPQDLTSVNSQEYSQAVYAENRKGKWTDFYRNATDHKGNKVGNHQVKIIKLIVNEG